MKNIKILLITGLIIQLTTIGALASASADGADLLVSIGEKHLNAGQVEAAIHEFSKALMIYPEHQKAREHLEKYGLKEGLYSGTRTAASDRARMARQLKDSQIQMAVVELEQKELKEIAEKAHETENQLLSLQAENNQLREENLVKSRKYSNLHSNVESYALVRSQVIEDYKDEVIDQELNMLDTQQRFISTLDDVDHMTDILQIQRDRLDNAYDNVTDLNKESNI